MQDYNVYLFFVQEENGLKVTFPVDKPCEYTYSPNVEKYCVNKTFFLKSPMDRFNHHVNIFRSIDATIKLTKNQF